MPTYEYVCTDCKAQWEEIQKISEAPLEVCPKCGHKTAKRQISGGNFILKGGGWYADLYSSSTNKSGGDKGRAATPTSGEAAPSTSTTSSTTPSSGSSGSSSSTGSSGSGSSGSGGTSGST